MGMLFDPMNGKIPTAILVSGSLLRGQGRAGQDMTCVDGSCLGKRANLKSWMVVVIDFALG